MNIHSVPCNLLKLKTEYTNVLRMLDVFCVCEGYLKSDIGNLYNLLNFDMYSLPRINNDLGGVLIYAKKFLNASVVPDLCSTSIIVEITFVNFQIDRRKFLVGSIYRSPLSSAVHFIDGLEDILQCINLNFIKHTVISAGEVNITLLLGNC